MFTTFTSVTSHQLYVWVSSLERRLAWRCNWGFISIYWGLKKKGMRPNGEHWYAVRSGSRCSGWRKSCCSKGRTQESGRRWESDFGSSIRDCFKPLELNSNSVAYSTGCVCWYCKFSGRVLNLDHCFPQSCAVLLPTNLPTPHKNKRKEKNSNYI